jgi:hypothetical protein
MDTLSYTTAAQASSETVVQLAASTTDMDFKGVAVIPAVAPPTDTPTMPVWALIGLSLMLAGLAVWAHPSRGFILGSR